MERSREEFKIILVAVVLAFIIRMTNNMVNTTAPLLARYVYGLSGYEVGLTGTVIYLFTLFSTAFVNPKLQGQGKKKIFIISMILSSLSLVGLYFQNIYLFWAFLAVFGFFTGFLFTNLLTSISANVEGVSRERGLAAYSMALSMSLLIGPIIERFSLPKIGYENVFLEFFPVMIAGSIISLFIKAPNIVEKKDVKGAINTPGFLAAILSITAYNVPFAAFTVFMDIYTKETFHVSSSFAYYVFIFFFAASLLTRIYMQIRPFKHLRIPLTIFILITVIAFLVIGFVNNIYVYFAIIAIMGIPHGGIFPIATILISRGTPRERLNAANSYFTSYNNILFLAVPPLFGYVSTLISYNAAFIILSIVSLISLILIYVKFSKNRTVFYK